VTTVPLTVVILPMAVNQYDHGATGNVDALLSLGSCTSDFFLYITLPCSFIAHSVEVVPPREGIKGGRN